MSTGQHYGQRCREAREAAGFSLAEARDRLRDSIPHRYVPSVKTLARIETGFMAEDKVDGIIIVGLAGIYGCKVSDLSTVVANELDSLRDLVVRSSRCIAA